MLCPIVLVSSEADPSFTVDALDVAFDEAFEEARDVALEDTDFT